MQFSESLGNIKKFKHWKMHITSCFYFSKMFVCMWSSLSCILFTRSSIKNIFYTTNVLLILLLCVTRLKKYPYRIGQCLLNNNWYITDVNVHNSLQYNAIHNRFIKAKEINRIIFIIYFPWKEQDQEWSCVSAKTIGQWWPLTV